ncbi:MAG TPA: hypothetical protein VES88_09985 [Gemmatimonadaceae bacterium]|nr:hypothetical protein [Gemmatimonadaceae bacterium]
MTQDDWSVELPKTAAAWGKGNSAALESVLEEELTAQADDLLEDACELGGWPEDEQVEVSDVVLNGNLMNATVTVYFTEVIPSSCKDLSHRERREHRIVIAMRRGDPTGTVAHSASDPNQWDLIDRNSAADGR